jgi:hypothetical protein
VYSLLEIIDQLIFQKTFSVHFKKHFKRIDLTKKVFYFNKKLINAAKTTNFLSTKIQRRNIRINKLDSHTLVDVFGGNLLLFFSESSHHEFIA